MLENALVFWLCYRDILQFTGLNFIKLSALMHFGARINASVFWVKRSKVKVTV